MYYHQCNEYQAVFSSPPHTLNNWIRWPGDEANCLGTVFGPNEKGIERVHYVGTTWDKMMMKVDEPQELAKFVLCGGFGEFMNNSDLFFQRSDSRLLT